MIPSWYRREIRYGDIGSDVRIVRRKLGLDPEGSHDVASMQRILGIARKWNIETQGEVNEEVARILGESAAKTAGLAPVWFHRDLQLWFEGEDVRALRAILGLPDNDNRYDPDVESAVRRFQGNHGVTPTGRVDEKLSRLLGETQ